MPLDPFPIIPVTEAMKPELLYESPFTDLNPQGPEGVFDSAQIDELLEALSRVSASAVA